MAVIITGVEQGSPACKAGIAPGHTLVAIGKNIINDLLDYRFYATEKALSLTLLDENGEEYSRQIVKGQYDDLGLDFETYLMDKKHSCKNKCIFCFIDQLPKGMRKTLYFKDDDERLSFLFGNYITLTNLTERDVERIIEMHISPINISVHTTDPELRVKMMANPNSGKVLSYIPRLTNAGIKVNTQLVLCPGVNDGEALERSLADLEALGENLQSIAVVPVGVTSHRQGLFPLRLFTADEAAEVVACVEQFGEKCKEKYGRRIAFAADEFYLAAKKSIPEPEFYEDFDQLENGVGCWALTRSEFYDELDYTESKNVNRNIKIATGKAAYPLISELCSAAQQKFPGLNVEVIGVPNLLLGPDITVAGLVSAGDIIAEFGLRGGDYELLFPNCMLSSDGIFLDDMTPEQLSERLGVRVTPVEMGGADLLLSLIDE